jgi:hypothetical protein
VPVERQACVDHPRASGDRACDNCLSPICLECAASQDDRCRECATKRQRKKLFFAVRVSILLTILVGVALYAWRDIDSREARKDWSRPLSVAVVVIAATPLEDGIVERLRERSPILEARLTEQLRARGGELSRPFSFEIFGPVTVEGATPELPQSDGVRDAIAFSWDLKRFSSRANDAAHIGARRFDSYIYVIASPPASAKRKAVEGLSQLGGRLGVVKVDLDRSMIDFALFVVTHELFHTLGASDKYDDVGEPSVPDGLAEPNRQPRYPQRFTELMARHRAVAPGRSVPPESLAELVVGDKTAAEIGWR